MFNHEHEKRTDTKEDDGIARETLSETPPAGGFEVFLHRQRPNIAGAAAIEIARGGMMDRVFPGPLARGGESQNTGDEAHPFIGLARGKK